MNDLFINDNTFQQYTKADGSVITIQKVNKRGLRTKNDELSENLGDTYDYFIESGFEEVTEDVIMDLNVEDNIQVAYFRKDGRARQGGLLIDVQDKYIRLRGLQNRNPAMMRVEKTYNGGELAGRKPWWSVQFKDVETWFIRPMKMWSKGIKMIVSLEKLKEIDGRIKELSKMRKSNGKAYEYGERKVYEIIKAENDPNMPYSRAVVIKMVKEIRK